MSKASLPRVCDCYIGIHFEHLDMGCPNQMIQTGVDAGLTQRNSGSAAQRARSNR